MTDVDEYERKKSLNAKNIRSVSCSGDYSNVLTAMFWFTKLRFSIRMPYTGWWKLVFEPTRCELEKPQ